jgi:hypothetical protein
VSNRLAPDAALREANAAMAPETEGEDMNVRLLPPAAIPIVALAALSARAVSLDAGVEADIELTTAYVWRGQVLNDQPCLQPALLFASGKEAQH